MESKYNQMQLIVIKEIAHGQISSLLELQSNKPLLSQKLLETKSKPEFKDADISLQDYFEDITESIMMWEDILERPETFLAQNFLHNYDHLKVLLGEHCRLRPIHTATCNWLIKKVELAKELHDHDN